MLIDREPFAKRHIGPTETEQEQMLQEICIASLDELIDQTVPAQIRLNKPMDLPQQCSEYKFMQEISKISRKNKVFKQFIGMGFYGTITPAVIQRNIFENPGWYTQYTPYQAEISQGRLEALLNFQTMCSDLTGLPVANASLLDEATAAAEAMTMLHRVRSRELVKRDANKFVVSDKCYDSTIDVLQTRAEPLGLEIEVVDITKYEADESVFGILIQYPDANGEICDFKSLIKNVHQQGALVAVATDLLALTVLQPPGEFGADVVIGSSQRFGVPLGFGGPSAAFFVTREDYKRQIPGRIIGVSVDTHGNKAYRMALQTREQHIRREKATSNICTAQALLAIMAGMYAVYHGPQGLLKISRRIHAMALVLNSEIKKLGYNQTNPVFFDTLKISTEPEVSVKIRSEMEKSEINLRYFGDGNIGISVDETTMVSDLKSILKVFALAAGKNPPQIEFEQQAESVEDNIPADLCRQSAFLNHNIFHRFHSETKMMRYIKKLENKDLSLTTSMIPLGSCTMKLNSASEMLPLSWAEFASIHPFAPSDQTEGYRQLISELEKFLCAITGFDAFSMQPNSGAQGEFASLLVIRAYHINRGAEHRNIVLIPSSAHGTNPASAVMAGMKVVIVKCDDDGNIDVEDLKQKAVEHKENLSALMVTYPSTHGVFEESIKEICSVIHDNGGQVFMDGANMNAQVGLTNPALIGADICHLNLHKTFAIPHGGGGPGMGPIGCRKHLAPFLPGHPQIKTGGEKAIRSVASSPFGSASILIISYAYIRMLGNKGLTRASEFAILNANYIKARLEKYFPVLYSGANNHVAHELIFDLRPFKQSADIEVEDVAKRLMDYNFHAPTVSFPVPGTLMVEPTESEAKDELDRFCDAMISIYNEIREISAGNADKSDNVLKNAPHTAAYALRENWDHPYSREKAVYPLPYLKEQKFWTSVGRIDNSYGDRNLFCTCPPLENYE